MLLTPQNITLAALFGLSLSFTMHQASFSTYYMSGRFGRITLLNNTLILFMQVAIISQAGFLIWYAYMTGIPHALKLIFLSAIFVLSFRVFRRWTGLHQRAWLICIAGIAIVPPLLIALIWIVRFPISN